MGSCPSGHCPVGGIIRVESCSSEVLSLWVIIVVGSHPGGDLSGWELSGGELSNG